MDIDYTVGEVELSYKPKFKNRNYTQLLVQ